MTSERDKKIALEIKKRFGVSKKQLDEMLERLAKRSKSYYGYSVIKTKNTKSNSSRKTKNTL